MVIIIQTAPMLDKNGQRNNMITPKNFETYNLNLLGIRDLRKLAFALGVYGYSTYSKSELIEHIYAVVYGNEPPKAQSGKGRPSSIRGSKREVFEKVVKKLMSMETYSIQEQPLELVASSTSSYDTGNRNKVARYPSSQILFKNSLLAGLNTFAPIGYGSRAIIYGNEQSVLDIKDIVLKELDKKSTILLLPSESPEEIEWARTLGFTTYSTTFGDSAAKTIKAAETAFSAALRLKQKGIDVTLIISSITNLAKCYNQNMVSKLASGENILPESLDPLKELFLNCHPVSVGACITLIAFGACGNNVDNIILEHLKPSFNCSAELCLKNGKKFRFNIEKTHSKYAEKYQKSKLYDTQKEIRQKLINGEIDNNKANAIC